jgi:hypothetical protein
MMNDSRANAVNLPARVWHRKGNDTLSQLYTEPKQSFLRNYGGRIAGGLACAAVVSLIMHITPVVEGIRWTGQIILWVFGKPAIVRHTPPFPKMKKKAAPVVEAVKDALRDHKPAIPKVAAPVVALAAVPKVAPKIQAIEKIIEKREEKLAKAVKGAGDKVKGAGDRVAKAIQKRREDKDQAKHDQLVVRAREAGVKVDDTWSLARLDAEVNAAEDARWKRRYNATCPNPRCRRPQRIRDSAKRENLQCLYCGAMFYGARARALGAPPRPHQKDGWRIPF